MKDLVEALCSDACAGRAPGTPGGREARRIVVAALRDAGLDPFEQEVPRCRGANVLATLPGDTDRWVVVAAHYDHLGRFGREVYRGADDNAAAVAILVEVARGLASARPSGRGVLVASFDAEEPPHFLTAAMGSEHFARNPTIPLERVDMMVCMDLAGHAVGSPGMPAEVRDTLFALGAERSTGTAEHVERLSREVPGVVVRRTDAEIIPPLSDYEAFWRRRVPFLFLSCGRSRRYHTVEDTPDGLDFRKMGATAKWLERFVRETCERPEESIRFTDDRDDAATLRALAAMTGALAEVSEDAERARRRAEALLCACDRNGRLPFLRRLEMQWLAWRIEGKLG